MHDGKGCNICYSHLGLNTRENLILWHANNKGTGQPVHLKVLINAFVFHSLKSVIHELNLLQVTLQYSNKTCVKRPLSKRPKIGYQDYLSLNAGQKYCRMLQREHSAILLTFIKLPFFINIFVLSIFECCFTQVLWERSG